MASPIWKVRAVKAYPEAHNHLLIGAVSGRDACTVEMNCRSFHFRRVTGGVKDIRVGGLGVRLIPWSRVEIINVLPNDFDCGRATLTTDDSGNVILSDGRDHCLITAQREAKY
jgi:hypothetical protein